MKAIAFVLFCCCRWGAIFCQENNVCETSLDYGFRATSSRCHYNPDVDSETPLMATRRGYQVSRHRVTTEDGYILSLFHISSGKSRSGQKLKPVYLQHGFFQASDVWVDVGDRSLAFVLADRGHDVWLGNFRGNIYSRGHEYYQADSNNAQYWNFSWIEMGYHDLSAMLNYVSSYTNTTGEIVYVGHSMGTTTFLVYNIEKKEEAEKNLKGGILLAPVANLSSVAPQVKLAGIVVPALAAFLNAIHKYDLFTDVQLWRGVWRTLCWNILIRICQQFYFLLYGSDIWQQPPVDIPLVLSYIVAGASLKTLELYAQVTRSGVFSRFDYGALKNAQIYGSPEPPPYDVSVIDIPVHMFYGSHDVLAATKDVLTLHSNLRGRGKTVTQIPKDNSPGFNHNDFLYAKNLSTMLYPELLGAIENLQSND